jgi:tetratricopeptide (TPR) repeat protein
VTGDRIVKSAVHNHVIRGLGAVLLLFAVACGGGDKKASTTPKKATDQSMKDTGEPDVGTAHVTTGGGSGSATKPATPVAGAGSGSATPAVAEVPEGPKVVPPNFDGDPAQTKSQVDQHLGNARMALSQSTPDPDGALREARAVLALDASNLDAAALVAFAYYHKKLYDTAELVLDDVFKREAAKKNAQIYYVYGLVYDHTNRPEQATLSFEKAIAIDPSFASALVDVGEHQLMNQRYAEAQTTFEKLTGQFNRKDAITLTLLGSAYRGHAADFPAGNGQHDQLVKSADAAYKRAIQANASYGPAYYNLGLLYLDNDPFPGIPDSLQRLNAAKGYFDNYKNMPGVDMKLYDSRMKDVTRAIKKASKKAKKTAGATP